MKSGSQVRCLMPINPASWEEEIEGPWLKAISSKNLARTYLNEQVHSASLGLYSSYVGARKITV
jgi:hypothetical protein